MKTFLKLQNIYKEHPGLYITGLMLILSILLKLIFPHVGFLLYFLAFSGLCCIIYGLLLHFENKQNKSVRITALTLRITALSLIAVFLISMIPIQFKIINGMKDNEERCDYVLVLGAGLINDKPTSTLVLRLKRAIDYIEKFPDTKIILCGGMAESYNISEAEAMLTYLEEQGVDTANIILEDKSTDTSENVKYGIEIIENEGGDITKDKIGVVTSNYHIYRSEMIMQKAGINNIYTLVAKTPPYFFITLSSHLREYFSVILEYFNL